MGSIITNNGEDLVWDEGREREIPASAARLLWCQDMLMDIIYIVSGENRLWEVWIMCESM